MISSSPFSWVTPTVPDRPGPSRTVPDLFVFHTCCRTEKSILRSRLMIRRVMLVKTPDVHIDVVQQTSGTVATELNHQPRTKKKKNNTSVLGMFVGNSI